MNEWHARTPSCVCHLASARRVPVNKIGLWECSKVSKRTATRAQQGCGSAAVSAVYCHTPMIHMVFASNSPAFSALPAVSQHGTCTCRVSCLRSGVRARSVGVACESMLGWSGGTSIASHAACPFVNQLTNNLLTSSVCTRRLMASRLAMTMAMLRAIKRIH